VTAASVAVGLTPPDVEPERVRQTVDEVLSRPEYEPLEPGFLERGATWLEARIAELLAAVTGTGEGALIGWALLGLAVAVVAVLVVRFTRGVRRDPGAPGPLAGSVGRGPEEWARDAAEHAGAGRYRDAVRCRYRALLAELAAAGLVEEVPGRTAGEYRDEIADAAPDAADAVGAVTAVFEAVWYGDAAVTADDLGAFEEQAARVRATAGVRQLVAR
jgi:hypothetical protein